MVDTSKNAITCIGSISKIDHASEAPKSSKFSLQRPRSLRTTMDFADAIKPQLHLTISSFVEMGTVVKFGLLQEGRKC
jgi:hypothetical protein